MMLQKLLNKTVPLGLTVLDTVPTPSDVPGYASRLGTLTSRTVAIP